jgi:hypothetical protein
LVGSIGASKLEATYDKADFCLKERASKLH